MEKYKIGQTVRIHSHSLTARQNLSQNHNFVTNIPLRRFFLNKQPPLQTEYQCVVGNSPRSINNIGRIS